MQSFKDKVFTATKKIPTGQVRTYKQIAVSIRHPKAYRAVGNMLTTNRSEDVPCHRVIRSNGAMGGYAWGIPKKIKRLTSEGITIVNGVVDKKFIRK